jgi:hypothetical protein
MIYGQNVMREEAVRQWCRMFKDWQKNFQMKSEVVGWPPVVSDDHLRNTDQEICERRYFTISELLLEFSQISRTLLYEIITVRLGYCKFCNRCVPKMLTGENKTQRNASAVADFSERYRVDGDEFLSHIVRVTGDETWVSFVNIETEEQSKQWMHTHSPEEPKKFKQRLSACQKADLW